ncbi:MAG TPA: hypothetical protein VIZ67_06285, partial [Acidimicrobiales bacterium]
RELIPRVAAELLDVDASPVVAPASASPPLDAERLSGNYERLHQRVDVTVDAAIASLVANTEPSGVLSTLGIEPMRLEVLPLDPEAGTFLTLDPRSGVDEVVVFAWSGESAASGISIDGRLHRRVD